MVTRNGRPPSADTAQALPYSREAERATLGAMMRSVEVVSEVLGLITVEDIYADPHRRVFQAITDVWHAGGVPDAVTVADRLHTTGQTADAGYALLAELISGAPISTEKALGYARIVRDKALLRRLALCCAETQGQCLEWKGPARELIDEAERKVYDVAEQAVGGVGELVPMSQAMGQFYDQVDAAVAKPGGVTGIATGLADLDNLTAGLHPGELFLVAARPGQGKTSLGLTLARNISVLGARPVLFVSLEMGARELAGRLACAEAGIDSQQARKGRLDAQELAALLEAGKKLESAPLMIADAPSTTVTQIAALARRMKRRGGLDVVFVDYVQLVETGRRHEKRYEAVGYVSRRLKALAKELGLPVVAMAQLNRTAEEHKDGKPRLRDLRESGNLEQDCDVAMLLHRPADQEGLPCPVVEVEVAKQRNGPTGTFKLAFRRDQTRFENYTEL